MELAIPVALSPNACPTWTDSSWGRHGVEVRSTGLRLLAPGQDRTGIHKSRDHKGTRTARGTTLSHTQERTPGIEEETTVIVQEDQAREPWSSEASIYTGMR